MMQVIVNNLPISYQVIGKGKNVLMLHGWGDSSSSFSELAKGLAGKYRCILVDLPGFGSSGTPKEVLQLTDFADFIASFLKKISVDEVHAIIGHSNGGAIAISGLASGRLTSGRLVLLASAGVRDDQKVKKLALKSAAKTAKLATKFLPKSAQEKLRKKSYQAIGSDMYVNEDMQETFKNVVSHDIQQEAKLIKLPTLLVYGQNDTSTPLLYGQKLQACINNSKYVELEHAGHFVHHDKPDEVIGLIKEFL